MFCHPQNKPCNLICCKTGSWVVKRAASLSQLVLQHYVAKQVARLHVFFCPFYRAIFAYEALSSISFGTAEIHKSLGGEPNNVMSKLLFEELLQLYLLDNDIFKMNIVKSWDLFTPCLPSQDTREQTVILDTWVIQVGSSFARSLGDKKAYCPIEVIIHSRRTVFRM